MSDNTKVVIALIISLVVFAYPFAYRFSEDNVSLFVKDKETTVVKYNKESAKNKYLIFTGSEVFEITDTILFFRWNSSDLYRYLTVGNTYNCRVAGWRIPFLSSYRNLIDCEE